MARPNLPTLNDIDVCVVDFDGCMVQGISKVAVAQQIGLTVARRPFRGEHRRYLPRLGLAAIILYACRFWQKIGGGVTDADLVRLYGRLLATIPLESFRQSAKQIPARLFPGVEGTFQWLAERWPVGVVSLALLEVLEAADAYLKATTGHQFAFICGNSIQELQAGTGTGLVLTAADKRAHMAEQLARLGCTCPLVIGHDGEDLGLTELAREMGGISLGLKPAPKMANHFDLSLPSHDWSQIPARLRGTLGLAQK